MTVPFPGESIGCADAWSSDGLGFNLYKEVWRRGTGDDNNPTAGHRAISAGTYWRLWAYSFDRPYLEAADDATPLTVAWVFEVLSGSGTLALTDGPDADWDYDTAASLPTSLGALTVSGPGTYVVPTSTFGNAYLRQAGFENGPASLRVDCIAGMVDLQQVKLRVWPAGGPLGGWSDLYTADPGAEANAMEWTAYLAAPGPAPTTEAEIHAGAGSLEWSAPQLITNPAAGQGVVGAGGGIVQLTVNDEIRLLGSANPSAFFLWRNVEGMGYTPPGAEGVDWVRNPEEVQYELDELWFDTTGPGATSWVQGDVTLVENGGIPDDGSYYTPQAGGSAHFEVAEVDGLPTAGDAAASVPGSGSTFITSADPGGYNPMPGIRTTVSLPEFAPGKYLRIFAWHDQLYADMPISSTWAATLNNIPDGGGALRYHWQPAPYRYWSPAAAPDPIPLQWRQRRDGRGMDGAPSWRGSIDSTDGGRWFGRT